MKQLPTIVPENKTVYIGSRKFVEGDIIPPSLKSGIEVIVNEKPKVQIFDSPESVSSRKSFFNSKE